MNPVVALSGVPNGIQRDIGRVRIISKGEIQPQIVKFNVAIFIDYQKGSPRNDIVIISQLATLGNRRLVSSLFGMSMEGS